MMECGSHFIDDSSCLCRGINGIRKCLVVPLWVVRVLRGGRCCSGVRLLGLVILGRLLNLRWLLVEVGSSFWGKHLHRSAQFVEQIISVSDRGILKTHLV